jgi:hypothetical protein
MCFSTLDKGPDGVVFIVMCFLCRGLEALAFSGLLTASYAISAHTFPEDAATMFVSSMCVLVYIYIYMCVCVCVCVIDDTHGLPLTAKMPLQLQFTKLDL